MAPKTAGQLREMLSEHGETAPKRWSKVELLQRVEEVTGVDYTKPQKKEKSEYQMYVTALNQAATRKATLQTFCRKTLDMEVNYNLTIAQLQKEALSVIYGKACPDPSDLVGFGRHSQLTYATVKAEHPQYSAWVIQTATEGQCNPRLRRLAGWLANVEVAGYPNEPTTPRKMTDNTTTPKVAASSKAASSSSAAVEDPNTVTVGTEVLTNLVQTIENLKEEMATLKGERPRKKASGEDAESTTSFSLAGMTGRTEAAIQCGKHDRKQTATIRCHMSRVEDYCDRNSIYLDLIPADAHWQLGVCEQAVQGLKHVLDRITAEDDQRTPEEALSLAVEVFNSREQIRGFTPIQHAFGRNPDVTGRLIKRPGDLPDEWVVENANEDFARAAQARASAEKALCDWQAQQRISRAMNSRSRPRAQYAPGDLVYFWRTQESGQGRKAPGSKHGRFLGPARVLATEGRREEDGALRAGSAVWLVRGRSLMKCSPEQLRHASPREEHLEALASRTVEGGTPWTFSRVAEEIGGNRYEDISGEVPAEDEWRRAQDPEQETPPIRFQPPRMRVRGKRGEPEAATDMHDHLQDEPGEPSAPSRPRRPRTSPSLPDAALEAENWWSRVPAAHFGEHSSFWVEESAAVEVAIDMPSSRRGMDLATRDLCGYFVSALKRKAVEVSEKRLSEGERMSFKEAKAVEVRNFVASKAFEALPAGMRPDKSQAMGMRWLLTWKLRDDGSYKAKARAVLLGYQDPAYAHRSTTSPVMTRQTRQMLLQVALNRQWPVYKGDVSGAFLQGREYPETLLCVPCDEICQAMGLEGGSVVRMRKACYGLVDAPLEWYRTVAEYFEAQGLTRLWSDACAWVYRKNGVITGIISGHVDDFLFSGNEQDSGWRTIIRNIKERFKWGDWDKDVFVQCGVQVTRGDNHFKLSQPNYVAGIPEIALSSTRRKQEKDETTAQVPGTLVTDSRNVYDKLNTEVLTIKGAERKSNLELLSVKEAQQRTQLHVRWVHSEAQLANSLTKANGGHEMELFYRMNHAWRIVEDPSMKSARRRKAEGLPPLDNAPVQARFAATKLESDRLQRELSGPWDERNAAAIQEMRFLQTHVEGLRVGCGMVAEHLTSVRAEVANYQSRVEQLYAEAGAAEGERSATESELRRVREAMLQSFQVKEAAAKDAHTAVQALEEQLQSVGEEQALFWKKSEDAKARLITARSEEAAALTELQLKDEHLNNLRRLYEREREGSFLREEQFMQSQRKSMQCQSEELEKSGGLISIEMHERILHDQTEFYDKALQALDDLERSCMDRTQDCITASFCSEPESQVGLLRGKIAAEACATATMEQDAELLEEQIRVLSQKLEASASQIAQLKDMLLVERLHPKPFRSFRQGAPVIPFAARWATWQNREGPGKFV
ncbi:RE1 [Symbiodinium sp. KB8]|nr:RE1 [Symbiodinium sp. KB8]